MSFFARRASEIFNGSTASPTELSANQAAPETFRKPTDFFEDESDLCQEVEENERCNAITREWSWKNLMPSDPKRYKTSTGLFEEFPNIDIPSNMEAIDAWEIDESVNFSDEGWMYHNNFLELDLNHFTNRNESSTVRRRRWIRRLRTKTASTSSTLPSVVERDEERVLPADFTPTKSTSSRIVTSQIIIDNNDVEVEVDLAEAEFEVENDRRDETGSVASEAISVANSEALATNANGMQKRNSFFSFGGQTSSGSLFNDSTSTISPSCKAQSSSASASASANPSATTARKRSNDPALKIHSTLLSAIGKQIKFVETECKKDEELRLKVWKENVKPILETTIIDLEKKVTALKVQIEMEAQNKGIEHIQSMEEELNKLTLELDSIKRSFYFPFTELTVGQNGVYLALTDFWLEYLCGGISLQLSPDKQFPCIVLKLNGARGAAESKGVIARLKLEGFRLVGDKGKGVPKLSLSSVKLTIGFTADIKLVYNHKELKWQCDSKDFKLSILSFKGPFGINRSIVGLVLSLLTPTIRSLLISNLPFELGLLIRTLPSPFTLSGDFAIHGMELSALESEWHTQPLLAKLCGYSFTQMEMFYYLQRALDRSYPIKNLAELIAYRRAYAHDRSMWEQLVALWTQASLVYCEKVAQAKGHSFALPEYNITFKAFLHAVDNLLMKRINLRVNLHHIDGQISLNHAVSFSYQIAHRLGTEQVNKATSQYRKFRLMSSLERLTQAYDASQVLISLLGQNLDFAQVTVRAGFAAGPEGSLLVSARDLLAQAPLLLKLAILENKNVGTLPLVPYIISFKPQSSNGPNGNNNGDLLLEIYHFTHDSSDVPGLMKEMNEHHHDVCNLHVLQQKDKFTNYANSVQTGCYSTSYNRVVTDITSGRTLPRGAGLANQLAADHAMMPGELLLSIDQQLDEGDGDGDQNEIAASWKHLLARKDLQQRAVEAVLLGHPQGAEADTILSLAATSPHISMIVDKAATLKPGAELFSLVIGATQNGWQPFGAPNMFEAANDNKDCGSIHSRSTRGSGGYAHSSIEKGSPDADQDKKATAEEAGMPVMMQTSPGIKMLIRVKKTDIAIHLPTLLRFMLAHFADLALLRAYLESLVGGTFFEEQLAVVKLILERLSKYLLLPVLSLDVNINGKLVTLEGEIMVRLETPERPGGDDDIMSGGIEAGEVPAAVALEAQLSLREIVQDAIDINNFLRFGIDPDEMSALTGLRLSNHNDGKSGDHKNNSSGKKSGEV